jgi:hypothetical protein
MAGDCQFPQHTPNNSFANTLKELIESRTMLDELVER